jgi:hypothetical protein
VGKAAAIAGRSSLTIRQAARVGMWVILRWVRSAALVFGWAIAAIVAVKFFHAPGWTALFLLLPFAAAGSYFAQRDRRRGLPYTLLK